MNTIPKMMRAVVLPQHHDDVRGAISSLEVQEIPTVEPASGQVVVKMEAAPCNPSDLVFLQGRSGTDRKVPAVPGWEGAGKVVGSGGGWLANWLVGKRVACASRRDGDGTWAEYCTTSAGECIPLMDNVRFRQAASLIVNPLTAVGLLDVAKRGRHRAAVHTAAASQLGRMMLHLAGEQSYPLICVVRRDDQTAELIELGAAVVLNSSDDDFDQQLREACRDLKATCVFDAIAGSMTGRLLAAMPKHSHSFVYGGLSEQSCERIDPIDLIYHEKSMSGFYLNRWIKDRGVLRVFLDSRRLQKKMISGEIATQVQRETGFDAIVDALLQYASEMSAGKVLLVPSKS